MSQHDFDITTDDANTGTTMRTAINDALQALVSLSSDTTEPSAPYAYQLWADTTTGLLKIRNAANDAWIITGTLASNNLGLLALSGGTMTGLLNLKKGTDIASATTIVLSTATGNLVHITGATETTAVTMNSGQWQMCIADGAWPLTYHATNLKINGGVSYTCAAGDRILFHYDGTTVFATVFTQAGIAINSFRVAASVGGTVDAVTAVHSPAFPALVNGMRSIVRAAGANTSATPTFAPDGLTAKTIVKENLAALLAGDITGAGHEIELIYNSTADKWILLNPKASGFLAATQAEQEAGSSITVGTTPGRQQYHPSAAKAFVSFVGVGTVTIFGTPYGVSSITDNAEGDYTVNLTTAFSSTDYVAIVSNSAQNAVSPCWGLIHTAPPQTVIVPTTTTTRVGFHNGGATRDPNFASVVFFGDL